MFTSKSKGLALASTVFAGLVMVGSNARAEGVEWKIDGFIKPSFNLADNAVNSFTGTNMVAPTNAAATDIGAANRKFSRASWQVGQSRIGLGAKAGTAVSGRLEFDFSDTGAKASPTVQAVPRLRVAKINYKVSDELSFDMGQDWDVFGPMGPHTYNVVGGYFWGGNVGFLRHQLIMNYKMSSMEFAVSLGMAGNNGGSNTDGNVEFTKLPVVAARGAFLFDAKSKVGISLVAAKTNFDAADTTKKKGIYGVSAYTDLSFGPVNVKAEGYHGQNLGNLGALSLGGINVTESLQEIGGFATAKVAVGAGNSVFGGVGYATITNDAALLATAAAGSMDPKSIKHNLQLKLGVDRELASNLKVFAELSRYNTEIKINAATNELQSYTASVLETGLQLSL